MATKASNGSQQATDDGPSHPELVRALQTLTSMASCWLGRAPVLTDMDRTQAQRLREVVAILDLAAAEQRKQSRKVLATLYRDEVAVALGTSLNIDRELPGNTLVERQRRFPHLPNQLLAEWVGTYPAFYDDDEAVMAIRAGFFNFTLLGHGLGENMALDDAKQYAEDARRLTATEGPAVAASAIVLEILREETVLGDDEWSTRWHAGASGKSAKTSDKRNTRNLRDARHPDRLPVPTAADLGEYFGARRFDGAGGEARTRAAAQILAEAAGGGPELAGVLAAADSLSPGIWGPVARGRDGQG